VRVVVLVSSCLVVASAACGGSRPSEVTTPKPADGVAADGGASADRDAGGPVEKPFAGSAMEATQLISAAIDKKTDAIAKCVKEYRQRKHLAHERVELSVGIDQEGNVLGVTLPKGKKDEQLSGCVMETLKASTFPRSHAGVITMTKSYEEVVQ
jgi:hypothetical protein